MMRPDDPYGGLLEKADGLCRPCPTLGTLWRFEIAARLAADGNPKYLAEYLRSDRPLTAEHREILARFAAGDLKSDDLPRKGRPPNTTLRYLASLALDRYNEARAGNRAKGLSGRGCANQMKDAALSIALEWYSNEFPDDPAPSPEQRDKIRELMDRPASRRR